MPKRRLDLWDEGDFSMLLMEGKMIQRRLNNTHRNMINNDTRIARTFAKLMNSGKIQAATQLLSRKPVKGMYNLDDEINDRTVREILKEKHPNVKPAKPDVLLQAPPPNIPEGGKRGIPYSKMVKWVRYKLSFALLRVSILCVRGSTYILNIPSNNPSY